MTARLARLSPPEGWVAVGLLVVMGLAVAFAIDDSRWFWISDEVTDFLPSAMLAGILLGLFAARIGWGRWTGHLFGAVIAALVLPIWVGERLPIGPDEAVSAAAQWPLGLYAATAGSIVDAASELARNQRVTASQFGPTLLLVGILIWGTGMFAATAVFRHHRPMSAIIALGLILVVNVAGTIISDQLGFLVIFSAAALLLLVRLHAVEEQTAWLRARLGDPRPVRSHTVRAGTAFALATVIGAFALTQTAVSAPLENVWPDDIESSLIDAGQELSALFPFVNSIRGPGGGDFSATAGIQDQWRAETGPAFSAWLPADAPRDVYWRAAAYDTYTNAVRSWQIADEEALELAAQAEILPNVDDPVPQIARQDIRSEITPVGRDQVALAPGLALSVSQDVDIGLSFPTGSLGRIYLSERGVPYEISGAVLRRWSESFPVGVSGNQLAAAGRTLDQDILRQYATRPTPDVLGPDARAFLADVKAAIAPDTDPYHLAAEIERRMRTEFRYDADVTTEFRGCTAGLVECFLRVKVGFCMHFATAMVQLLRNDGIPARMVMGYLPGARSQATDGGWIETVDKDQQHAWVEAYFPRWGWIRFDPTALRGEASIALPEGPLVPIPSAGASQPLDDDLKNPPRVPARAGEGSSASGQPTALGTLVLAILAIVIVGGGAAIVAFRIRARSAVPAGIAEAYGGVVGLATRLGYGPRPSQTVYEYADTLGALVPVARDDLMTVATARVESAYGRRQLGSERLASVADAVRRLRVSLLRLFFRRGSRGTRTIRRPRR